MPMLRGQFPQLFTLEPQELAASQPSGEQPIISDEVVKMATIDLKNVAGAQVVDKGGSTGLIEFDLGDGRVATVACDIERKRMTDAPEPKPEEAEEEPQGELEVSFGPSGLPDQDDSAYSEIHYPGRSTPPVVEEGDVIEDEPRATGDIPADFAYASTLAENGITTFEALRDIIDSETDDSPWYEGVKGVGEPTAAKIAAALAEADTAAGDPLFAKELAANKAADAE